MNVGTSMPQRSHGPCGPWRLEGQPVRALRLGIGSTEPRPHRSRRRYGVQNLLFNAYLLQRGRGVGGRGDMGVFRRFFYEQCLQRSHGRRGHGGGLILSTRHSWPAHYAALRTNTTVMTPHLKPGPKDVGTAATTTAPVVSTTSYESTEEAQGSLVGGSRITVLDKRSIRASEISSLTPSTSPSCCGVGSCSEAAGLPCS